jgi:hypothetical protein
MRVATKFFVCVAGCILAVALTTPTAYAAPAGPVSKVPAAWTPHLPAVTSTTMTVRQLAQCGNTMYTVGTFSQFKRYSVTVTRNNAMSFNATTGAISAWDPNVNGVVNSVSFSADCNTIFLGGKFTIVHGVAANNFAAVNSTTGAVITTIPHSVAGQVESLFRTANNHLLIGGYFTAGQGSNKPYLFSVNPATGRDDNYVNLAISGNYNYVDDGGRHSASNATRVYNMEVGPDGTKLLVMGDFTSVAGQHRQQIFMLDLGASAATLDAWYSPEFNQNCATVEPYWLQAAAWSPDQSKIYITTTGYKPANGPGYLTSDPRAGLCDAAAAFSSASQSNLSHLWVNYTGCDSYFAVAADANDVYVAGHERWQDNPLGCDHQGPGAVSRPGLGAIDPTIGLTTSWNPTRARGLGADDAIITTNPPGLWIASDNYAGSDTCGGLYGHAGICFLPYS